MRRKMGLKVPPRSRNRLGTKLVWITWFRNNLDADERLMKEMVEEGKIIFGDKVVDVAESVRRREDEKKKKRWK